MPTMTPEEKKVIAAKIDAFTTGECVEKAIEETKELLEALQQLCYWNKMGSADLFFDKIRHVGREYMDVVISVGDTFSALCPSHFSAPGEEKREHVYTEHLPNEIAKRRKSARG